MINYLRISVTDRCNLSCNYCSSGRSAANIQSSDLLTFEEIEEFVRKMTVSGIKYVRLTGGEPLLRKDLPILVGMLKRVPGIEEVSMTTNGILFAEHALELKKAGLDRVNISLDTLKPDRFRELTHIHLRGGGGFEAVWRSVMNAIELDLRPVKINVILFKGINDDEVLDFVELAKKYDVVVRFIEYMGKTEYESVLNGEVKSFILRQAQDEREAANPFTLSLSKSGVVGHGPAKYIKIAGSKGAIGFISPVTEPFCKDCNRLRLSSDGKLYPCLFSEKYIDMKVWMRNKENVIPAPAGDWSASGGKVRTQDRKRLDMCYIGG